jgi:hypothetical protein
MELWLGWYVNRPFVATAVIEFLVLVPNPGQLPAGYDLIVEGRTESMAMVPDKSKIEFLVSRRFRGIHGPLSIYIRTLCPLLSAV